MNRDLEHLVWQRAGGVCEYCRMPQAFDEVAYEIDHIIAQQHDGPTIASNLCAACFGCNHGRSCRLDERVG